MNTIAFITQLKAQGQITYNGYLLFDQNQSDKSEDDNLYYIFKAGANDADEPELFHTFSLDEAITFITNSTL